MANKHLVLLVGIFSLTLLFVRCSSSNSIEPVTQPHPQMASTAGHISWGIWQFQADLVAQTLDIVQLRSGNFHLNALLFLEPPPLSNLTLESVEFNQGVIEADIGLRNPFLGMGQFTGFDVKGILISKGSNSIPDAPELIFPGKTKTRLLNADGFTRWWNPYEFPVNNGTIFGYTDGLLGAPDAAAEFNATLNGYKYYADDIGQDDGLDMLTLVNRGMFSGGQKNIRHYSIQIGDEGLIFNYAVDAAWVFPQGPEPWQAPDDFPPAANQREPYRVEITEIENTLAYEASTGFGYGELHLRVDVYDWVNADMNIISCWSDGGELAAASSSSPSCGGDGYSTYELDIIPQNIQSTDDIDLWVAAECQDAKGYGGLLPDKAQGGYFRYATTVIPYGPPGECGGSVHRFVAEYPITGVSIGEEIFWLDMGLQEVGTHAGKAIIQTNPDKFSAVDITGGSLGNATPYFSISNPDNGHLSVDCCPYSGRIILADGSIYSMYIKIFDVNGTQLSEFYADGLQVSCLDIDDNGDLWIVGYSEYLVVSLVHYQFQAGPPYYTLVPADTISIASQFPSGVAYWMFGDIAIDYEDQLAFIMGAVYPAPCEHYLAVYDISGTPTFINGRDDVFSGGIGAITGEGSYAGLLDIEIDHSLAEYCRIVVSGQLMEDQYYYTHQLVRLESDLTTIDTWTGCEVYFYDNSASKIIISPYAPHDLLSIPTNTGYISVYSTSDW